MSSCDSAALAHAQSEQLPWWGISCLPGGWKGVGPRRRRYQRWAARWRLRHTWHHYSVRSVICRPHSVTCFITENQPCGLSLSVLSVLTFLSMGPFVSYCSIIVFKKLHFSSLPSYFLSKNSSLSILSCNSRIFFSSSHLITTDSFLVVPLHHYCQLSCRPFSASQTFLCSPTSSSLTAFISSNLIITNSFPVVLPYHHWQLSCSSFLSSLKVFFL